MQTILRLGNLVFVAGLLWMSPTLAAKQGPQAVTKVATAKKATAKKPVAARHYKGVASWYGIQHQGRKMANGQKFDRHKLTAACWFLPLGTVVRVINLKNGNAVQVTIADRGPNHRLHRVIDLSEAAATELDFIDEGLTSVFLTPLLPATAEPADLSAQVITPLYDTPSPNETALNLLPESGPHP